MVRHRYHVPGPGVQDEYGAVVLALAQWTSHRLAGTKTWPLSQAKAECERRLSKEDFEFRNSIFRSIRAYHSPFRTPFLPACLAACLAACLPCHVPGLAPARRQQTRRRSRFPLSLPLSVLIRCKLPVWLPVAQVYPAQPAARYDGGRHQGPLLIRRQHSISFCLVSCHTRKISWPSQMRRVYLGSTNDPLSASASAILGRGVVSQLDLTRNIFESRFGA